jgi:Fe-S cluster assembly ATP-binding protein
VAIPGVSVANLVRMSSKQFHGTRRGDAASFRERLRTTADSLKLDPAFVERSVNDGFSGGEKKQSEILQMAVLEPQLAILDEPDSGLDIDALKRTAQVMNGARTDERTFLVITHYERLLQHIRADAVHIMLDGRIVRTGDATLATELERSGYQPVSASAR